MIDVDLAWKFGGCAEGARRAAASSRIEIKEVRGGFVAHGVYQAFWRRERSMCASFSFEERFWGFGGTEGLRLEEACDNEWSSACACDSDGVSQWSGAASARRLPMPARETEAIILKTFPLGEADRVVSFLGRASGRLRGVAAGARRLKNRFGSTLEVLSHVQIWYVERETRELVRIQQTEPLESLHKAQSDYGLSTGLAVISEIAELVLPEHEASEPMFRLILLSAREIERTGNWELPLSYFAFWTVRLGGWLPRFDRCASCGSAFDHGPAFYDAHRAGLFCEKCRRPGMKPLHQEARGLAERFTGERVDRIPFDEGMQASAGELRRASFAWIELNAERRLITPELLETP